MSEEHKASELDISGLMQDGLRELIELVNRSGLTELKIERGGTKLVIRAASQEVGRASSLDGLVAQPSGASPSPDDSDQGPEAAPVISPIVGTFYASPRPNDAPYVQVGDRVETGQTVGVIEAMKIMNEIETDISGTVVEILVQNGQAVEYGTQLMLIDASAAG